MVSVLLVNYPEQFQQNEAMDFGSEPQPGIKKRLLGPLRSQNTTRETPKVHNAYKTRLGCAPKARGTMRGGHQGSQ